jgi:IS30 family transposase
MSADEKIKGKHLTEESRSLIKRMLDGGFTFKEIGEAIGKDPTTVAKEIKKHRYFKASKANAGHKCIRARYCEIRGLCKDGNELCLKLCCNCHKCISVCRHYTPYTSSEVCRIKSRPPYVCNGCENRLYKRCLLGKYYYSADHAHMEYVRMLSESRQGVDKTADEMAHIADVAVPLIKKGQPLSHIYAHHSNEIGISMRTFYRYVDGGYIGLKNIDMRRVVRYKKRKHHKLVKPVRALKVDHVYEKFLEFTLANPEVRIAEMDLVEGKVSDRQKLLTLMPRDLRLMIIRLLPDKTMESAARAIAGIADALGMDVFSKLFPVVLTDNDSCFADPLQFELDADGVFRTKLFYCEPHRSDQKGSLEKNHEYIRYIIPKGKTFDELTEADVRNMMNHINSTARPDLDGESPMERALREFGKEALAKLGMELIPYDEVCLTTQLIKPVKPAPTR